MKRVITLNIRNEQQEHITYVRKTEYCIIKICTSLFCTVAALQNVNRQETFF